MKSIQVLCSNISMQIMERGISRVVWTGSIHAFKAIYNRSIIKKVIRSDMNSCCIVEDVRNKPIFSISMLFEYFRIQKMNSKTLAIVCAVVYLAGEVMTEIDTSMEYSNIVKQVNMQEAIINNLQRVCQLSNDKYFF